MTLGGEFQPVEHHIRRVVPAHGIDRQCVSVGQCPTGIARGAVTARSAMWTRAPPGGTSGTDRVLERLTSRDHFAAIIMAAMTTDVMGPLEFTAVAALRMGFLRQRLMAATHSRAGRRRLAFRNSHAPSPLVAAPRLITGKPGRLADRSECGKADFGRRTPHVVAPGLGRASSPPRWLLERSLFPAFTRQRMLESGPAVTWG